MRAEVKLLQRRIGITILFVTHDQNEALSISDRIAVMSEGRIEQLGTPEELYSQPRTRMVRDFVGKSNVLRARVVGAAAPEVRVRLDDDFGGDALVAGRTGPLEIVDGSACEISIRHEDVGIQRAHGSLPLNALRGRLGGLLFLGDRYEAVVNLPGGPKIVANVASGTAVREGDDVWAVLPMDKLVLWPSAD
jgi:ABC-type Fe3+/spermidine/putrescine transport system ATPase subunit